MNQVTNLMKNIVKDGYVAVHVHTHDVEQDPKDHPHAPAGSGKGGQFVKKEFTMASASAGKNAVIRKLHKIISNPYGGTPAMKAGKLKDIAAEQKAPIVASYANKLIAELEESEGLKKGELGKAIPGKVAEGLGLNKAASEPKKEEPAKGETTPVDTSHPVGYKQNSLFNFANSEAENKIETLEEYINNPHVELSENDKAFGKALLDELKNPAAKANEPTKTDDPIHADKIPEPYSGAANQEKIHTAATKAANKTKADQIASVKKVMDELPDSANYASEYGKKVLAALGTTYEKESSTPAATSKADTPKPAAAPKSNPNTLVSKRAKDLEYLGEISKAYHHKTVGDTEKLRKIFPTAGTNLHKVMTNSQIQSFKKYITSSGASAINNALRDPKYNASQTIKDDVNNIEDAFEHESARATEDAYVERGTGLLANTKAESDAIIATAKMQLEQGLPARHHLTGCVSTSVVNPFVGNIKLKILVKKGARAIYLGDNVGLEGESELLLNHGQAVDFLKYEHDPAKAGGGLNEHVLTCVVRGG